MTLQNTYILLWDIFNIHRFYSCLKLKKMHAYCLPRTRMVALLNLAKLPMATNDEPYKNCQNIQCIITYRASIPCETDKLQEQIHFLQYNTFQRSAGYTCTILYTQLYLAYFGALTCKHDTFTVFRYKKRYSSGRITKTS